MRANLRENRSVRFRVLSEDQCEEIRGRALEVLERTGVSFYEPRAVELLRDAGCHVKEQIRVLIPSGLVQQALATAPPRFTVYDRDGKQALRVEPNEFYFGPGPTCPYFLDPWTGERRPYVKQDAALTARLCDALPNIDYVMSLGSVSDVPQAEADVHEYDAMLRETVKPIMSWSFGLDSLERIYAMSCAVKGSPEAYAREPFMIFYAEPSSPLKQSREAIQKLLFCAERMQPLVYTPCPIGGGTAPATMAGILVQSLAEDLAGVVLSQLVRPGAAIVIGGVVSILDMRTTILSYGAPELSLLSAALTELARFVGLPVFSTAGCTDSKLVDQQAAIEAAISIVTAAFSGANLIHDVGFLESAMTGSLDLLAISDEIIGMVKRIVKGIDTGEEHYAVDAIAAGSGTGDFLALDHTLENFRKEFWFPRLMDRRRHGEWVEAGAKSMLERTHDLVVSLLEGHRARPLPADVLNRLDATMQHV